MKASGKTLDLVCGDGDIFEIIMTSISESEESNSQGWRRYLWDEVLTKYQRRYLLSEYIKSCDVKRNGYKNENLSGQMKLIETFIEQIINKKNQ